MTRSTPWPSWTRSVGRWALALLLVLEGVGALGAGTPRRLAAEPARPRAWEPARTWALLVGVLSWRDPSLATYPTENRQDRALERALLERGVPREQVTFLEDREATRTRIQTELARTSSAAGEGSTLVLYYAGHGIQSGTSTWFANYDVDPQQPAATGWGLADLGKGLRERWKGRRLWVMADCCHSGALREVVDAAAARPEVEALCVTSALDCNLSTARWTFTEAVVAALRGEGRVDLDGSGVITFGELDRHVSREMRFREAQLTVGHRAGAFDLLTPLRGVDPLRAVDRLPGAWQVGDFVECLQEGTWYRAEIVAGRTDAYRVHYLGYEEREWVKPERVRAPTPLEAQVGARVEIEWKGRWWPGSVVKVEQDFAFVRYEGYGPEWDEWVTAKRLRART